MASMLKWSNSIGDRPGSATMTTSALIFRTANWPRRRSSISTIRRADTPRVSVSAWIIGFRQMKSKMRCTRLPRRRPGVLRDPPVKIFLIDFAESAVQYEIKFWLMDGKAFCRYHRRCPDQCLVRAQPARDPVGLFHATD